MSCKKQEHNLIKYYLFIECNFCINTIIEECKQVCVWESTLRTNNTDRTISPTSPPHLSQIFRTEKSRLQTFRKDNMQSSIEMWICKLVVLKILSLFRLVSSCFFSSISLFYSRCLESENILFVLVLKSASRNFSI